MHEDITNRKTFAELTASQEAFGTLVGKVLLFNRESPYFKYSGLCRGAILEHTCPDCGRKCAVLAFSTKGDVFKACEVKDMEVLQLHREYLENLFYRCDAFVGRSAEDSFLLDWSDLEKI